MVHVSYFIIIYLLSANKGPIKTIQLDRRLGGKMEQGDRLKYKKTVYIFEKLKIAKATILTRVGTWKVTFFKSSDKSLSRDGWNHQPSYILMKGHDS